RQSQAAVVSTLIDGMVAALNRDFAGVHVFGGESSGGAPIEGFYGGYRYVGRGQGLATDLGPGLDFPITLGADQAAGALSARVKGDVDLNRRATDATLVADLRGPGGENIKLGSIVVPIDDGANPSQQVTVALTQAETLGDVADVLESAIRETDGGALQGAYPAGIQFLGDRFRVFVDTGYTIRFSDGPAGTTA